MAELSLSVDTQENLRQFVALMRTMEESLSEARERYATLHAVLESFQPTPAAIKGEQHSPHVPHVVLTTVDLFTAAKMDATMDIEVEGTHVIQLKLSDALRSELLKLMADG